MTADASPGMRYLVEAGRLVDRLLVDEWPRIRAGAELMADTLARGGVIHAFGTGHSHMLAEELFYRAGGLVRVEPILFEGLMLHAGARLSTALERLPGLGEAILDEHPMAEGDVLVVASNSGGNVVGSDPCAACARSRRARDRHREPWPTRPPRRAATRTCPCWTPSPTSSWTTAAASATRPWTIDGLATAGRPHLHGDGRRDPQRDGRRGRGHPRGARHAAGGLHQRQPGRRRRARTPGSAGRRTTRERRSGIPVRRARRDRGLLRQPVHARAAAGADRLPRRPRLRHLRLRARRTIRSCARAGGIRTTGDDLARFGELVERCHARGLRFVVRDLARPLDPVLGREPTWPRCAPSWTACERSAWTRLALLLDDIPPDAPASRGPGGLRGPGRRPTSARRPGRPPARSARTPGSSSARRSTGATATEAYLAALGAGIDPARGHLLDGARDLLAHPGPRRRDGVRGDGRPGPALLGQLPGQRRRHGLGAAHRPVPRPGPPPGRGVARGIVANPMELLEASRIPLATIGTTSRTPSGYDPEAAWAAAIREVAGPADAEAFAAVRGQRALVLPERGRRARRGHGALEAFSFRLDQGEGRAAAADLAALADRLRGRRAPPASRARGEHGPRGRLPPLDRGVRARGTGHPPDRGPGGRGPPGHRGPDGARPYLARLRRARVRVFGDALDMTLADLTGTHVRPGRMLELERGGDSA